MESVDKTALQDLVTRIFSAKGVPEDIAEAVARSLVLADLSGHQSHGVIRVPGYLRMIDAGQILMANRPEVIQRAANTFLVDGRWGFGYPAAELATALAAETAKRERVALVGIIHMNHVGRLGQWAEQAADLGVILLMAVGGEGSIGAPFGGKGKALSTNPMAAAIPAAERNAFIMDFATTAIAEGKLQVAQARGSRVPAGTIIDKDGNPTTDPEDFYSGGALLPFGGHKGYALALMVEALASCLTGASQTDHPNKYGALLIAIGAGVFQPPAQVRADVDRLFARVTAVTPAAGFDRVRIPGEPEVEARERHLRLGIEFPEATVAGLREAAAALGVQAPVLRSETSGGA